MRLPDMAVFIAVSPPFVPVSLDQKQILAAGLNLAVIFANYFKRRRH